VNEFVKTRPAGPGAFGHEAAGLRWLEAAGRTDDGAADERSHGRGWASGPIAAGRTGGAADEAAPVVQVLAVTEHRLTLERLTGPRPDPVAARLFGQRLARTHDADAARFGAVPDGWDGPLYIGAAPLPAGDAPTWGAFYLAMLALFRAPHLDAILAGYESASPHLPGGWRDLIGLHQLHPLLVHAVLFGASYGAQAAAVARRYG